MAEPQEWMLWKKFEHTGKVEDYLSYLQSLREHGEEQDADQNRWDRPSGTELQ